MSPKSVNYSGVKPVRHWRMGLQEQRCVWTHTLYSQRLCTLEPPCFMQSMSLGMSPSWHRRKVSQVLVVAWPNRIGAAPSEKGGELAYSDL